MKETRCLIFQPGIDDIWYQCWEQSQSYVAIRQNTPNLEQLALPSTYHLTPLLDPSVTRWKGIDVTVNSFPALTTLYVATMKKNPNDVDVLYDILKARKREGNVINDIYLSRRDYPRTSHPILEIVRHVHTVVPRYQ